jgi:AcrR family transcriptional regulator
VRLGLARTTASDIAKAAGVSRATLYRRFGSHEAIFLAVLTRESEAMFLDAERHLAGIDDPARRLVEGMVFSIGEIRRRPVHAALFTTDDAAWAARRALRITALHRIGEDGVRPLVAAATGGQLTDEETGDLVGWILRLMISYAAVPGPGELSPQDIRRQLVTLLVPAVRALIARVPTGVPTGGHR